ncbi:unnamed protein product [Urochloa decumbens]|uniref:4-coumarate--CoA ligase n=1 Tax=Urochloa decumbens TaxID=240449 RepID=A0ABC8XT44_9POAL
MASKAAPEAGYGDDGVYRSLRPATHIPSDPSLSLNDLIFRRAETCPAAPALVDAATGIALTFAGLRSASLTAAAALAARAGVGPGDVVLLLAPNCVLYPVCFLARSPRRSPTPASSSSSRLPAILLDDDASVSVSVSVSVPAPSTDNVTLYRDLIDGVRDAEYRRPAATKQSDTAAVLYSSGTTGASKGVVLTHGNFIAAHAMVTADQGARGEGHSVFLCFLPMFHLFGLSVVTLAQLQRGNAVVVMPRFDAGSAMAAVERHRVTHLYCVPPVMIALAKHGSAGRYDLSSLKLILSGAAPLGRDVMEAVAKDFPGAEVVQGYGMTETCGIISLENPERDFRKARQLGSTGTLVINVEAKIVDVETLKHLPPNQLGEICVRGPNIIRSHRLSLRNNNSIMNPEIHDAVVIPFPDTEAGEVPVAYVVRSPQSSLSEADVQNFIEKQVASYKRLRRITFVDSVPKSPSGKILRRELISQVRQCLLRQCPGCSCPDASDVPKL